MGSWVDTAKNKIFKEEKNHENSFLLLYC